MVLSAFPAMAPQQYGAHTVLTGFLDRSALYGVLAEIEALGRHRTDGPPQSIALMRRV